MPRNQPVVRGDDSAFIEARGCYTTALVTGGVARFAERHADRLQRDAARLRIGEVDRRDVLRAFAELSEAAFSEGEGIIRLQASRDGDGALHLVGIPREVGEPSPTGGWAAVLSEIPHEGSTVYSGCKVTHRLFFALALDAAHDVGADEALLFDTAGFLVEGARSAVFVADRSGALITPPLERGCVFSIGREVVLERIPQVIVRDLTLDTLRTAEEIIAVNAVRGARPIHTLGGRPVGGGHSRWFDLLSRALATD